MALPYLLMTMLFGALAVLAAWDSSFSSLGLAPWFNGLRWMRVHFITLGLLSELIFGLAPTIVAARAGQAQPRIRWDIWLALNGGLLVLVAGIPLVNGWLIFVGGSLVFSATILLMTQLGRLQQPGSARSADLNGRWFYVTGLAYLLLGIIVGTGLWLGWGPALGIQVPLEVHIHANNWGFMSLSFVGLLIDVYPGITGRQLAWPRSLAAIFWMMTIGAFLLVLGPWLKNDLFAVPGIILHLSATFWLLANVIRPIWPDRRTWKPGIWHVLTSYVWIVAPVLVAPLIILKVPGFPGAGIEQNAPQALVYGWVLQFGVALIPYLFSRWLFPGRPAALGGSWFSLGAIHIGGVLLWASIFLKDIQGLVHGAAYLAWAVALVPLVVQIWRLTRESFEGHAAALNDAPRVAGEH